MRYYRRRKRHSSQKVKKVFLRILFIIAAAIIITALAMLLGNHIKNKVEEAEKKITSAENISVDKKSQSNSFGSSSAYNKKSPITSYNAMAIGIDVNNLSEENFSPYLDKIKSCFDTISVEINKNGQLIYNSPALLEFIGINENTTENNLYLKLKDFCNKASVKNINICAVVEASHLDNGLVSLKDRILIEELVDIGFDEIIISGIASNEIDLLDEYIKNLMSSKLSKTAIGISLPAAVYTSSSAVSLIKSLESYISFFCIDCNLDSVSLDDISQEINSTYSKVHQSELSSDNLRFILSANGSEDDTEKILSGYTALSSLSVQNLQILNAIDFDLLNIRSDDTDDKNENLPENSENNDKSSDNMIYDTNPYATTSSGNDESTNDSISDNNDIDDNQNFDNTENSADNNSPVYNADSNSWY